MGVTLNNIRRAVCDVTELTWDEISGPRKYRHLAEARNAFVWIARTHFRHMSYPRLGKLVGGRDHTTIIHAFKQAVANPALTRECCEKLGVACDL
jgi:chromosomal replication initiation ATPase DnaA